MAEEGVVQQSDPRIQQIQLEVRQFAVRKLRKEFANKVLTPPGIFVELIIPYYKKIGKNKSHFDLAGGQGYMATIEQGFFVSS